MGLTSTLEKALDWFNRAPSGASNEERRLYVIARFGLPMGLCVHAAYCILFFQLGQTAMAWYNVAILPIWGYAVWSAVMLRPLQLPLILAALLETGLHALLATLYMGLAPFFIAFMMFSVVLPPHFPFWSRRVRVAVALAAAGLMVAFGAVAVMSEPWQPVSTGWNLFFFINNTGSTIVFIGLMMALLELAIENAEAGLRREYDRAEGLLRNILPDAIAARLKDRAELIADDHAAVSVLFADIAGFTRTSAGMPPRELVALLDALFSAFDALTEAHGCEKIKTIGDAYMAAAGLPAARNDHAEAAVALGLDMIASAAEIAARAGVAAPIRVGVNSGPVVAGVIGHRKFAYDLWGDTVNVAARMEEHAAPGGLQVTRATRDRLGPGFDCRPLGVIEIKGKDGVEAFAVTRSNSPHGSDRGAG